MEKLTGKCKEDFLNFYWNNYIGKTRFLEQKSETEDFFNSLYPILKNALIIEFFDSIPYLANQSYWEYLFYYEYRKTRFLDYKEATNEAITKANEIYNSKQ